MRRIGCVSKGGIIQAVFIAALICLPGRYPAAAQEASPIPTLPQAPCTAPTQAGFDCVMAQVPLDYAEPAGPSITLSVVRHTATDRDHRIGTLFMNPGGPGGQGTVDLPDWISLFSPTMQARFDIISWDPRWTQRGTWTFCAKQWGERTLNYLGTSYGTFLGAVYANVFPGNVRAMTLDGNLTPSLYTKRRPACRTEQLTALRHQPGDVRVAGRVP